MADHLDAPGLKSPAPGDARTDITDIYAFQKPGDPGKSILMLNVNPLAPTLGTAFAHKAVYQLNVDTDGDAVANRIFTVRFSQPEEGEQEASVSLRVLGKKHDEDGEEDEDDDRELIEDAPVSFGSTPKVTTRGGVKFFAGIRSDPFFFDLLGFLAGFKFTGSDFFADKNVFGIVLEVPNTLLGSNPHVGIWGRTRVRVNGSLVNDDRMGRPAINTVFNHGQSKNVFNQIDPSADRTALNGDTPPVTFEASFIATLEHFGHPAAEAKAIADILLPDILTYDFSNSGGFLNGRKLTDDVIDIELTLVSNGAVTTDGVGAHTDYLASFPFLGNPH